MRFSASRFDRHLNNIGQDVLWRRSFACSCVSPTSGAPDPKCRLCFGKGRIWESPVTTRTGVAGQDVQAKWAKMGRYADGDVVLTIPQESVLWDCGQYDRVTQVNSTDKFSMPLVRGGPSEKLLFVPTRIDRCFWRNPTTHALVEAGIPVVAPNGTLSWPVGQLEPPAGTSYSLSGWRNSEFFVFDHLPSSRNEHGGMRLPKKVVLRRWDLFGR